MSKFYEIKVRRYCDNRGVLSTFESKNDIPFEIKRVYYLSELSQEKDRAHHAHIYSERVLTVMQGGCKVTLFDGKNKAIFLLDSPEKAVYFDKLVWCELSDFKNNAIVLALASDVYREEEYIRDYRVFVELIEKQGNKI